MLRARPGKAVDHPKETPMNARRAAYWITTTLVALIMLAGGSAYLMRAEVVVLGVTELGYPASFIPVLGVWKVLGALAILAPRLPRVKEWAYAGFAINIASAIIAHLAMGEGIEVWGWAAGTGVLWALSYVFWRLRPGSKAGF